jgi:hypothetical protein
MPTRLVHLVVDAADPAGLARFWSRALAWPVTFEEPDEVVIEPPDDDPAQAGQVPLVFVPVPEPKTSKNRVHLDVASTSDEHKAALVALLEGLGAPADRPRATRRGVVGGDGRPRGQRVLRPHPSLTV